MNFRVATSNDVADIVELVHSAYRGDASRQGWTTEADLLDGQRTDEGHVASLIDAPDSIVLIASARGHLIGCCHIERRHDATTHFGLFAVRPTEQGAGHGSAMLEEAESMARAVFDATTLEMDVLCQRVELLAFYERRGYARTGMTAPFPYGDEAFGLPRRDDLEFAVLAKRIV